MAAIQPMTFLQMAQRLRQEGRGLGASGTPTAVTGQTGDTKDYVDWIANSWNEIQIMKSSWRWMYGEVSVATNTTDREYALATIFPVAGDLERFSHWKPNSFTYKVDSIGASSERPIRQMLWENYIRQDWGEVQTVQTPSNVIVMEDNNLMLKEKVSEVGTLKGRYYKKPQGLAANGDIPEMPAEFHMLIVWNALIDHAVGSFSAEQIARARERAKPLWYALINRQLEPVVLYSRTLA